MQIGGRKKIVIGPKDSSPGLTEDAPAKWRTILPVFAGGIVLGLLVAALIWLPTAPEETASPTSTAPAAAPLTVPEYAREGVVTKSLPLAELLSSISVPEKEVNFFKKDDQLTDFQEVESGSEYVLYFADETETTLKGLLLKVDAETYINLEFRPYARVSIEHIPTTFRERTYAGQIQENIWLEILERPDLHHTLIPLLEEATKYTVDIFHLSPGTRFQLAYTERLQEGRVTGVEKLNAITIKTVSGSQKTYRIYRWENDDRAGFVNPDGLSVKSRYLKAPVKFSIISSPYSKSRRHPVTGDLKPHNGTDYAAPEGAPIFALADGVVEKAKFEKNNGNNVRLVHDARYKTQYLHMSKISPGLEEGVTVRQGDVIGYVGQTGLATGPHVCLRFWEDNRQVDFLANSYVSNRPLPRAELDDFIAYRDSLTQVLEAVDLR